jgi:hypothetical protein
MAKVAKKNASSAKKSIAAKKVVVKKAPVQKKSVAKKKVAPVAAKKKATTKPVAKKAPVKKVVAKKVVAKKAVKPAAPVKKAAKKVAPSKKVVSKKVATKAVVKTKAKVVPTKAVKAKVVAKKVAPVSKAKAAPVIAKAVVAKVVKEKTPKKVEAPKKAVTVTPVSASTKAPAAPRRKKKKKDDDDDDDEEVVVFRKPAKPTRSASAVKKAARNVSEELTMEGPAPRRVGQITMSSDEKVKLKKSLLNKCIDIQKQTVSIAKKAMEDALSSANAEKVSEELSDSFRESMHATRDMYARQANEGVNNLGLLNRINIVEHDKVKFGSVVFTNFQNYFISTGLGEIKVDDLSFQAVSTLAPLFQILVDKRKGDTFMFLDRLYTVIEVF